MRRRSFLLGAAGVAGLVGLAGWRLFANSQQQVVMAVLRYRLGYLRLDEAGLKSFADEIVKRQKVSALRLRVLGAFWPLYKGMSLTGHEWYAPGVLHGEERVITAYLLSSDFFQNGASETRPVRYVGFYDPEHNPVACSSPFARSVTQGPDIPPGDQAPTWPTAAATAAAR
jgi:hypothetical protein